jgi:hypothetical protein
MNAARPSSIVMPAPNSPPKTVRKSLKIPAYQVVGVVRLIFNADTGFGEMRGVRP